MIVIATISAVLVLVLIIDVMKAVVKYNPVIVLVDVKARMLRIDKQPTFLKGKLQRLH